MTQPPTPPREQAIPPEGTPGGAPLGASSALSAVMLVPIRALLPADSPRSSGTDREHARLLAECGGTLPPIIVHRPTNRVVDGMHRLRAAEARGESEIRVRYFDGPERDAYVIAVRENIAHGLPLTAADRSAAAARILASHPHWSDRAIALAVGLSTGTVSAARRRLLRTASADADPGPGAVPAAGQPQVRVGRDGRARPVDVAARRMVASELIKDRPDASLRNIAQWAGISPSTVRDVRDRMRRGDCPVPDALRPRQSAPAADRPGLNGPGPANRQAEASPAGPRRAEALGSLMKDPSLKHSEGGRLLLRLLGAPGPHDRRSRALLVKAVPAHRVELVGRLARDCADAWLSFAHELEHRPRPADQSADEAAG